MKKDYLAIFYVGGHGPCLDLAEDETSIKVSRANSIFQRVILDLFFGMSRQLASAFFQCWQTNIRCVSRARCLGQVSLHDMGDSMLLTQTFTSASRTRLEKRVVEGRNVDILQVLSSRRRPFHG